MSLKDAASTINEAVIYHSSTCVCVHSQLKFAQKLQNLNELRDFRKHAKIIGNCSRFPLTSILLRERGIVLPSESHTQEIKKPNR